MWDFTSLICMRNLIAFLKRFRIFIVFAILQGVALSSYFTNLRFPRSQYLTTASALSGKMMEINHDVTKHFNLAYNNRKLQYENIQLRRKLAQSNIKINKGVIKINDTIFEQHYDYTKATVLNSTVHKRNNYFTLNIGKSSGVYRGMGVISNNGVVGIIHTSSEHFSIVKTVLTENINIDVMVEKTGVYGLLKWNGKSPKIGTVSSISNDLSLKKWSKIVTRGGSGIFPKGIPVGKIKSIKTVEGKPLWDVEIYFSEKYGKHQYVYVIKNLLIKEQKKIEATIPNENE